MPGIGTFQAFETKAYIDHQEGKVYPSSLSVQWLQEETNRAESLVQHLIDETGYPKNELENELADLCFSLTEELKKGETINFLPFGQLTASENGIVFLPTEKNLHHQFFGLEALEIQPVQKIFHAQIEERAPIKSLPRHTIIEFRNIVLIIAMLLLILICFWFCPVKKTGKSGKDTSSDISKVDSLLNQSIPGMGDSGNLHPTLLDTPKNNTLDTSQYDSLKNEEIITIENVAELNDKVKNKTCVIIVGSFLKISNARRMEKKVIADGYQVYKGNYNNFNRVGISFDCLKHDLAGVLTELKKKYSQDSWVLKY